MTGSIHYIGVKSKQVQRFLSNMKDIFYYDAFRYICHSIQTRPKGKHLPWIISITKL